MYKRVSKIKESRLEEILGSANPNTIKEIYVAPYSARVGDISGFEITVGVSVYDIWVADSDEWYTKEGIKIVENIIKGSRIPFKLKPTKIYKGCELVDYLI